MFLFFWVILLRNYKFTIDINYLSEWVAAKPKKTSLSIYDIMGKVNMLRARENTLFMFKSKSTSCRVTVPVPQTIKRQNFGRSPTMIKARNFNDCLYQAHETRKFKTR